MFVVRFVLAGPLLALAAGSPLAARCPQTGRAQKVSASLDYTLVTGDVAAMAPTTDGQWVVYRAQQDEAVFGLYAVRTDLGLGPIRLSPSGLAIDDFRATPDAQRIVYRAAGRLHRVGTSGVSVALTPDLPGVVTYRLAPGGQYAVYSCDLASDGSLELYAVNLYGSPNPLLLSGTTSLTSGEYAFELTPDGTRAVFLAVAGPGTPVELFVAPLDASAPPAAVCGPFVSGGNVFIDLHEADYLVSPDSSRVVYRADQLVDGKVELFSAPLDLSSAPERLNGDLPANGDVEDLAISPDGGWVAYVADQETDGRLELYSVPIDGSLAAVNLNGGEFGVYALHISPDGTRVAYRAAPGGGGFTQVFVAPIDGSAASIQVSDDPTSGFTVYTGPPAFTPDSASVLYRSGRDPQLRRAPADGSSAPVVVNHVLAVQGQVVDYRLAADGNRLVYDAEVTPWTHELWSTTLDGSQAPSLLHAPSMPGTMIDAFELAGDRAFFLADLDSRQAFELFSAPLDAGTPASKLNAPLTTSSGMADVTGFALSADGTRLAYTTTAGVFAVTTESLGTARTLTSPLSTPAGFNSVRFAQGDERVVFRGATTTGNHLFSALFEGEASAIQLSTGVFAGGFGAGTFLLSPDGSRVIYHLSTYDGPGGALTVPADGSAPVAGFAGSTMFSPSTTADGTRLVFLYKAYSPYWEEPTRVLVRPFDASTAAVELAPFPLAEIRTTVDYALTPDESLVVFCRDEEVPGKTELYVVPVAGGVPTKLSDAMADDRDVSRFHLTPDGTRVVYLANRDAIGTFELYVVPVDGSAAPLELNGPMVSGGNVMRDGAGTSGKPLVWFTPDSMRAVYVADEEQDQVFDLWSVPLDGSAAPVRLTQLVSGGDVYLYLDAVKISADGTRVVFYADALQDFRFELFSAPIDGSSPAVPISGTLASTCDVEPGFLMLDALNAVLYRSDAAVDQKLELWLAPIDGSVPPSRRSWLGHDQAEVEADFQLSPDGKYVYYRADAVEDERTELFRFPLVRIPRTRQR